MAQGDGSAVRELISRYGGLVYSLARRFSYDHSEVEDAVQDVFIALWKSADRFNESIGSEETFVAMVTRRRLIDRRRRNIRRNQGFVDSDVALAAGGAKASEPAPELSEQASRAATALAMLRPEQQQVLRLSIMQGMSHDQIAKATNMPLGTVKTHVRRGLIALRESLAILEAHARSVADDHGPRAGARSRTALEALGAMDAEPIGPAPPALSLVVTPAASAATTPGRPQSAGVSPSHTPSLPLPSTSLRGFPPAPNPAPPREPGG